MAKVLFVQKKSIEYQSIVQLSAVLKGSAHICDVLIFDLESDFYTRIKEFEPDIVIYSYSLSTFNQCLLEFGDSKNILTEIR